MWLPKWRDEMGFVRGGLWVNKLSGSVRELISFNDAVAFLVSLPVLTWERRLIRVSLFPSFSEICWIETHSPSLIQVSSSLIAHPPPHTQLPARRRHTNSDPRAHLHVDVKFWQTSTMQADFNCAHTHKYTLCLACVNQETFAYVRGRIRHCSLLLVWVRGTRSSPHTNQSFPSYRLKDTHTHTHSSLAWQQGFNLATGPVAFKGTVCRPAIIGVTGEAQHVRLKFYLVKVQTGVSFERIGFSWLKRILTPPPLKTR